MLRRRLFVLGVISFVAGITASPAEPVNRQLFVNRNGNIGCTDDPGGTPCRRSLETGSVQLVTPQASTESEETRDDEITTSDEQSRSLDNIDDSKGIEEGRKKRKGRLRIFFLMAAAAKATLLYVMVHATALVAGKALFVAKIALALAAAVALKKLLGDHHEKTSYEIVKHPHHSYSQTHSTSVDYDHHGGGGFEGGHRRKRRSIQ